MSEKFTEAAKAAKDFTSKPTDEELLKLYALYKQATVGDCDTSRPGILDFKGKAKWDAWDGKKGMTKDDAEGKYIELVDQLKSTYKY